MQQIKRWIYNHLEYARKGTLPEYNGPADDLSPPKSRCRLRAKSPEDEAKLWEDMVMGAYGIKRAYTLPNYKQFMKMNWEAIGPIINHAYMDYRKCAVPIGEKHMTALVYRNKMARNMLAAESDEMKERVENARKQKTNTTENVVTAHAEGTAEENARYYFNL